MLLVKLKMYTPETYFRTFSSHLLTRNREYRSNSVLNVSFVCFQQEDLQTIVTITNTGMQTETIKSLIKALGTVQYIVVKNCTLDVFLCGVFLYDRIKKL